MMKTILLRNKSLIANINVYRIVVTIGFIAAMALTIMIPARMADPDDWAYYYAVRNFSQGQLTVDTQTHQQQISGAQQQGGQLIQYYNVGNNKWALEKAPGYVFYLVPFEWLGIPRFGNVLLALGMVIITFILLKRLRDEKAAMIGSLLILFTPMALVMLNRSYMDTYASLSFLAMGGGLYLYYHLERNSLTRVKSSILLFLAFFLICYSVFTRYTNGLVAVAIGLHFVIIRIMAWRRQENTGLKYEILPVLMGVGLPVLAFLFYNYLVFGSPWTYGYDYTRFGIKFAFQYLGQVNQVGQSTAWQIILGNLRNAPRAFLAGYSLLIIAVPGLLYILYLKLIEFFQKENNLGKWSSLRSEISWDLLLILISWIIGVFGLYLTYEWTAGGMGMNGFVIFDRFYLPGLFPLAIIAALILARFPVWIYTPMILVLSAFGSLVYSQWALNLHILPNWILNGSGRMPPGGRPGIGPGDMPNGGFPGGGPLPGGNFSGNGGNFQSPINGGGFGFPGQ